jgi:hypothetical protein
MIAPGAAPSGILRPVMRDRQILRLVLQDFEFDLDQKRNLIVAQFRRYACFPK